jgi:methyl-accepting chemotaxis protein
MSNSAHKRRRVIVDNLQYRLLIAGIMYFSMVVLIFASAVFVPVIMQVDRSGASVYEMQDSARQFLVLHERVWPPLICAFVLLIMHSILTSHRIAGPLYRIRAVLKLVGEGDISQRIKLRRNDYMNKEADIANEMMDSLSEKIDRLKSYRKVVSTRLATLGRSAQAGSMDEVARQADELSEDFDAFVRCLGEFKTQRETTGYKGDAGEARSPQSAAEAVTSE